MVLDADALPPPTVLVDGELPYPEPLMPAPSAEDDGSGLVAEATGLTLAGWHTPWLTRSTPMERWFIENELVRRAVQELNLLGPLIERNDHYFVEQAIVEALNAAIREEELLMPGGVPALGSALETALSIALPITTTYRGRVRDEVRLTTEVLTRFIDSTAAQIVESATKAVDATAYQVSLEWDHRLPRVIAMLRRAGVRMPPPSLLEGEHAGTNGAAPLLRPVLFIRTNSAGRAWAREGWAVYRAERLRALFGREDSTYGASWSAVLYDDDRLQRQREYYRTVLIVPDAAPPLRWSGSISPGGHRRGLTICCALSGEILMDYGEFQTTELPAPQFLRSPPSARTEIRGGDTLLRDTIPIGRRGEAGASVAPTTAFVALSR
jgi:hypothetical protein